MSDTYTQRRIRLSAGLWKRLDDEAHDARSSAAAIIEDRFRANGAGDSQLAEVVEAAVRRAAGPIREELGATIQAAVQHATQVALSQARPPQPAAQPQSTIPAPLLQIARALSLPPTTVVNIAVMLLSDLRPQDLERLAEHADTIDVSPGQLVRALAENSTSDVRLFHQASLNKARAAAEAS